jgi:hypothetical protein
VDEKIIYPQPTCSMPPPQPKKRRRRIMKWDEYGKVPKTERELLATRIRRVLAVRTTDTVELADVIYREIKPYLLNE